MKKITFTTLALLLLASCGSSASYTENSVLGTLPSICEQFYASEKQTETEAEAKMEEMAKSGDYADAMTYATEVEAELKEKKAAFKVEYEAELAKIVGRDVPVTYSNELQNSSELFYTISDAKIIDHDGTATISMKISAKADFTVARLNGLDHTVCYSLITTDGKAIVTSVFLPIGQTTSDQTFTASQVLQGADAAKYSMYMSKNASEYVNFAGIEFITSEQYKQRRN